MPKPKRFKYSEHRSPNGEKGEAPQLPLQLSFRAKAIVTHGLLDTGASVSVLPFSLGLQPGLDWDKISMRIALAGNLADYNARGLVLDARVEDFNPVNLVFAWTKSDNVSLILGQMNFFKEFDVCFFGSKLYFEVKPKE